MILRFILRFFFLGAISLGVISLIALQAHAPVRDCLELLGGSVVFAAFFWTTLDEEEREEW